MSLHSDIAREIDYPDRLKFEIEVPGFETKFKFQQLTDEEIRKCYDSKTIIDGNEKIIAMACVYPDLNDKELQDSYEVNNQVDLLYRMIPDSKDFERISSDVKRKVVPADNFYSYGNQIFGDLKKDKGDAEISIRMYAMNELNILPSQFDKLSELDRSYIVASSLFKAWQLKKLEK